MKTINDYRGFVFTIENIQDNNTFIVDFPDIPEIITSGITLYEAYHNACEALDLHLEVLTELGQPFPKLTKKLSIVTT